MPHTADAPLRAVDVAARLEPVLAATPWRPLDGSSRRAAVLIVLYDAAGTAHLVLTLRPATLAHHAGQVSLPGGRFDPGDGDLATTALRETEEELGVPREAVRVIGRLDDVHARGSDHIIAPYVGVLAGPFAPVPNASEIARVLEVPLRDLLAHDELLPAGADDDVAALRYPLLEEDVWGATARILRRFAALVREALAAGG